MPDIQQYVKQLKDLKMQSMEQYNQAMENYKTNYPQFYQQLVTAMKEGQKEPASSKLKDFLKEYKFYLAAIGGGVVVIIILLFLLLAR